MSPTLAAHMAATYQRISGGRLLLNVVTGGDDAEQRRFGDHLGKDARYRAGRRVPAHRPGAVDRRAGHFTGEYIRHRAARRSSRPAVWPEIYLGGSSAPALEVAARYADVYLTWGEPPAAVAEKLDAVRERAKAAGRELRFGIRLHVIARDTAAEAWAEAQRLLDGLDPAAIERAQAIQRASQSEGQRRMTAAARRPHRRPRGVARTCGRASGWCAAARAPRWSAATRRSPTASPSTTGSASTSSSCPATRTWRRPTRSAEGVMPVLRRRGLLAPSPEAN